VARRKPPKGFESSKLELASIKTGARFSDSTHRATLIRWEFGFAPSRFSDPRVALPENDRFGIIYFGSSLKVCFLERVLRDLRNGQLGDVPMPYAELEELTCAEVTIVRPLNVVFSRAARGSAEGAFASLWQPIQESRERDSAVFLTQ
jgi:hypothetical protein